MNSKDLLWIPKNYYEFRRIPMDYNEFYRILMNSYELLRIPSGFIRIIMNYKEL